MTPELQAIHEVNKSVALCMSALGIQLVEIQAMVNVVLDLQRQQLESQGHAKQDVAQFVEASFQAHRKAAYEVVQARLRLANPDIDLGSGH